MSNNKRFLSIYITLLLVIILSPYFIQEIQAATANHIVISEIKLGGETSNDEFIELYNPTNQSVDLTNWKLTKKTSTGTESNIIENISLSIKPHSYVLLAHEEYTQSVTSDLIYSNTIIANNNTILLYDQSASVIDKVGMGTANDFEGASIGNPAANKSIERKARSSSTAESMNSGGEEEQAGNGEDNDNNSEDFLLQDVADPQNSSSPAESVSTSPTPSISTIPSITPIPTITLTPTITPTDDSEVVISEIQVSGESSTDEFIELYNNGSTTIDLTDWKLTKLTASGAESNLVSTLTGVIAAHGYYLVSHENYTGALTSDIKYSTSNSVAANNSVRLYRNDDSIADTLGLGEVSISETTPVSVPETNNSVERKALTSSTVVSMSPGGSDEFKGNGYDSNNNENDFIERLSNPQNSTSPIESLDAVPSVTPTPTSSPTSTPTNSPTATNTPTVTTAPTLSPTATPTQTPTPTPREYQSKTIAIFPLSNIVCTLHYEFKQVGWFRFYYPRITCSRV